MRVGGKSLRLGLAVSVGALAVAALALHSDARAGGGQPVAASQPGLLGITRPSSGPHALRRAHGASPSGFTAPIPGQLVNHGGPVMSSNTVYAMYWEPGGGGISSGFSSTVDGFFSSVASDSGKTSNVFADAAQYGAAYNAHFGGSAVDTDALPGNGCSDAPTCITTLQILQELDDFEATPGWTGDAGAPTNHPTKIFFVFLPQGVSVCQDTGADACDVNSDNPVFCGYHTYGWDPSINQTWILAVMPYDWTNPGCDSIPGYPSGNSDADAAINVTSHEYMESITDPKLNAWYDSGGNEVGDKCAWTFGSQFGNVGGQDFNQEISSGDYQLQLEYSNKLQDCFQVGPPTVTGFSPSSGAAGDSIDVNGTNLFGNVNVLFNGIASPSVTDDSPTQVTATVPTGSFQGRVTVQTVGGNATSAQTFGAKPVVSGLSETSGYAGDVVTVTGSGFVGVKSVKIGGVSAPFNTVAKDGSSLKVVIPSSAVSGQVTVSTAYATSTDPVTFTVDPKVTSVSPVSGVGLANVTVSGSGLAGATAVDFNGDPSPHVVSNSATSVVVQVPVDATNGHVTVTTAAGTSAPSVALFKPLPRVSSLSGDPAQVGDVVTVNGSEFTASGSLTVKLGSAVLSPGSVSATSFTVTVPDGVVTGSLQVSNGNGSTSAVLHVRPSVSSGPSPSEGVTGSTFTLQGAAFTGTSRVTVGGVAASFAVLDYHDLRVTVPAAALSGPVSVTNAGGTTVTAGSFTVDPKITGLSPASGRVGSTVTIVGSGLAGATAVDFGGGVSATPISSTATNVRVVVPAGALSGPLTVHTASSPQTATSTASFTVT